MLLFTEYVLIIKEHDELPLFNIVFNTDCVHVITPIYTIDIFRGGAVVINGYFNSKDGKVIVTTVLKDTPVTYFFGNKDEFFIHLDGSRSLIVIGSGDSKYVETITNNEIDNIKVLENITRPIPFPCKPGKVVMPNIPYEDKP